MRDLDAEAHFLQIIIVSRRGRVILRGALDRSAGNLVGITPFFFKKTLVTRIPSVQIFVWKKMMLSVLEPLNHWLADRWQRRRLAHIHAEQASFFEGLQNAQSHTFQYSPISRYGNKIILTPSISHTLLTSAKV